MVKDIKYDKVFKYDSANERNANIIIRVIDTISYKGTWKHFYRICT